MSDAYIHVVVSGGDEYHIELTAYEKLTHLIETKHSVLIEFIGRFGQIVAFIPSQVVGYIVWDVASKERYIADNKADKNYD